MEKAFCRDKVKQLVVPYLPIEYSHKSELRVGLVNLNKLAPCVRDIEQNKISSELPTQKHWWFPSYISGIEFDAMRFEITLPNDCQLFCTRVNHRQKLPKPQVF